MDLINEQNALHYVKTATARAAMCSPPDNLTGRGIIICGGGKYAASAWVAINILRRHGCTLPIQLWYLGAAELSPALAQALATLKVEPVNAYDVREKFPHKRLHGWEVKAYALLHCPWREVMLLDADNIPLRDVTELFEDPLYLEHGSLFWPDRGRFTRENKIWSLTGVAYRDEPEFESGQMLVDRRRCWREVVLANWFNEESAFWYQHIHGDKDTFRLAWRSLGTAYGIIPFPGTAPWPLFYQKAPDGEVMFHHGYKWQLPPTKNGRVSEASPLFPLWDCCYEFLSQFDGISAAGRNSRHQRRYLATKHASSYNGCLYQLTDRTVLVYRSSPETLASCLLAPTGEIVAGSECDFDINHNADPRLFQFDGDLWMSTSYYGYGCDQERVELRVMDVHGSTIRPRPERLYFEGVRNDPAYIRRREKNWTPWEFEGSLYYTHMISPHRVCVVDFVHSCVRLQFETAWRSDAWKTDWGTEFRGNSSPVRLDETRYLSTFHTVGADGYYTGFYTFEAKPPFRVLQISSLPVLTPVDATGANWRTGCACVFILSIHIDGGYVRMCGGDNDHSIVVIDVALQDVLGSLVDVDPVGPVVPGIEADSGLLTIRKNTPDAGVVSEIYFGNEYRIPQKLDGKTVVDIGAHIGAFSCRCLDSGAARVISFEPGRSNFEILCRNTAPYQSRVVAYNEAVGPANGQQEIQFCEYSGAQDVNSSVRRLGARRRCVSLDRVLREIGRAHYVKLDCEGMEYPILYSCREFDRIDVIIVEWHEFDDVGELNPELTKWGEFSKHALKDFLEKKGFKVEDLNNRGRYGVFTAKR